MRTLLGALAVVSLFGVAGARAEARPHPADPLITAMYVKYVSRMPEADDRAMWRRRLEFQPVERLEAYLLGSGTYYRRARSDPRLFIIAMHYDVLGIAQPAPEEVDYWLHRLYQAGNRERLAFMFLLERRNGSAVNGQPTSAAPPPTTIDPNGIAPPPPTQPIPVLDRDDYVLPRPLPLGNR